MLSPTRQCASRTAPFPLRVGVCEMMTMPGSRLGGLATQRVALSCLTVLVVVCAGCSDSSGRVEIGGRVAFKSGEAVKRGSIEFSPLDGGGVHGGARIADGLYGIPRAKGLKAGKYLVRIYAPSALLSGNGGPGGAARLPEETVSSKFNSNSQLNVEVGAEAAQEFDFVVE